jgi:hypothetical protein
MDNPFTKCFKEGSVRECRLNDKADVRNGHRAVFDACEEVIDTKVAAEGGECKRIDCHSITIEVGGVLKGRKVKDEELAVIWRRKRGVDEGSRVGARL